MDRTKKILFSLVIGALVFMTGGGNGKVLAQGAAGGNVYTYVLRLYLTENNQLVQDRDYQLPVDLIVQQYSPLPLNAEALLYRGEILSVHGEFLSSFVFNVATGKNSVLAPYFPNAKTADFYDNNGQKVLSIDVAPSGPLCDEDGICGRETGESYENCPKDCPLIEIVPVKEGFFYSLGQSLAERLDFLPLFYFFWGGLALAGLLVIVLVFMLVRRKKQNVLPPPQI